LNPIKTSLLYQETKQLLKLAVPLASAQVAQALTGFCDTLMMGRLGASTLAAGGLASITLMTVISIAGGVLMAVSPLVAEAYGAGNKLRIKELTQQGLTLSLILTLPIMVTISNIDSVLLFQGQDPVTVALADNYLDIMVWACFPALGLMMLKGIVSSLDHARPIMIIVIGGTAFNILGNYLLAFGKLGLPRLEIVGLAISSVITFWSMFGALVVYIFKQPQLRAYRFFDQLNQIKLNFFGELIKLGVPIGIFIALESGLFAVVTYLMGALGTNTLAAHQIVLQTVIILFMIPLGISYATTIRTGQWLGKTDILAIKRVGYISVSIGLIFSTVTAVFILLFPQVIIGLYLDLNNADNLAVIEIASPLLAIGVLALILDGMQKIIYGILQGLQDTKIPMLLSIPAFWGIGLATGYFLSSHFGMGGVGLWLGQSIGLAIAAIIFTIRLVVVINSKRYKPN